MAVVDLVMPKMGESIMEATILKWHKQPGDHVKMDETVLEIATDKVDTEVPSTTEGVIEEILYNTNDVVPVGSVIARIKTSVEDTANERPHGGLFALCHHFVFLYRVYVGGFSIFYPFSVIGKQTMPAEL